MITKSKARFVKNTEAKKIIVTKEIDAPVEKVWEAFTTASQLDKWWGPKPWNAVTKKMDFKEGGSWLYHMAGPQGEKQWAKVNYKKINAPKEFTASDEFTDEKGNANPGMPGMQWRNSFTNQGDGTKLEIEISFDKKEDMDKILKMGFEDGFNIGLNQLDELVAQ